MTEKGEDFKLCIIFAMLYANGYHVMLENYNEIASALGTSRLVITPVCSSYGRLENVSIYYRWQRPIRKIFYFLIFHYKL